GTPGRDPRDSAAFTLLIPAFPGPLRGRVPAPRSSSGRTSTVENRGPGTVAAGRGGRPGRRPPRGRRRRRSCAGRSRTWRARRRPRSQPGNAVPINRSRSSSGTEQRVMLRAPYPLHGGIMRKLAGLAGALALAAAVGACSSSGRTGATATATPRSGTETITAALTGAPAASYFTSGGATSPSFPSVVFAGVVNTTIRGPVT